MSVPGWLQTLRSLRPAHVVAALPEGNPLLLLNPRDLRRADDAPIVRVAVPATFLIPALLRAARDANALVTLAKPGAALGEGPNPRAFAAAVLSAADELGFGAPLVLASAPLPIAGERTRDLVQRFLDAAFTELVFACPEQVPDDLGPSLEGALATLRERELPFTLAAPDADRAAPLVDALAQLGIEPDLVALESPAGAGALAAGGIELPFEAVRAGLRGVDLSGHVGEVAREATHSSDEPARLRAEALVYAEFFRVLSSEPFRGAAARAMRVLAEQPGY